MEISETTALFFDVTALSLCFFFFSVRFSQSADFAQQRSAKRGGEVQSSVFGRQQPRVSTHTLRDTLYRSMKPVGVFTEEA